MVPLPETVVPAGVIPVMSPLVVAESSVELALVIDTPEKDFGLPFFDSVTLEGAVKVQTPPDGDAPGEAPGDAPGEAPGDGSVVGLG